MHFIGRFSFVFVLILVFETGANAQYRIIHNGQSGARQYGGQILANDAQQVIGSGQYRSPSTVANGSFIRSGVAHGANGMIRSAGNVANGQYGFQNAQNYGGRGRIIGSNGAQGTAAYRRSNLGHATTGSFRSANGTQIQGSSNFQNPGRFNGSGQFTNSNMNARANVVRENGVQSSTVN